MLHGHVRGCLAEPTTDDAVLAGSSVNYADTITDIRGIKDAFDCTVRPH